LSRALAVLALVLALLVAADTGLRHRRARQRQLTALLRPLASPALEVVPERVRHLRVEAADGQRAWEYEWSGRAWRLPGMHGAFAAGDRVDFLLRGLLQSAGTVVATQADQHRRFGVAASQAPRVVLRDGRGDELLTALLGRPAPDQRGAEAYVRCAGSDTVLHLHANPLQALGGSTPLLDPHVLPRALSRRTPVKIALVGGAGEEAWRLRRVEAPPDPARPPSAGAAFAWLLVRAGRQDTCETASVGAYLHFLSQLQYQSVLPPHGDYGLETGPRLVLVDDQGAVSELVLGRRDAARAFLRHAGAGLTFSVEPAAADLLLPEPRRLLEALPQPSPYDAARPGSRSP